MRETSENQHNKSRGFLKDSLRAYRKNAPAEGQVCPALPMSITADYFAKTDSRGFAGVLWNVSQSVERRSVIGERFHDWSWIHESRIAGFRAQL